MIYWENRFNTPISYYSLFKNISVSCLAGGALVLPTMLKKTVATQSKLAEFTKEPKEIKNGYK